MLATVRDRLAARGYRMLEGDPTPRFSDADGEETKLWSVRYETRPRR